MPIPDPWKHRGAGMQCGSCMWFVPKARKLMVRDVEALLDKRPDEEVESENPSRLGRCRRHAPTMAGYPAVFVSDWCGDHKLDENCV